MKPRHRRHAVIASTFVATLAVLPAAASRPQSLDCSRPFDWFKLAMATYAVSRIIAREKVGGFIREPIQEAADETDGYTWMDAFADLVVCSRCVGVWSAASLTYLRAFAPTQARVAIDVLSLVGANNFLQAGFTWVTDAANGAAAAQPNPNDPTPADSFEGQSRVRRAGREPMAAREH